MSDVGEAMEAARPWLSTGGILGLLGLALRQWVVIKRLRITERGEDREGYGALIEQQNEIIKRQDERITRLEKDAEQKKVANDAYNSLLRHRISNLKMVLAGVFLVIEADSEKGPAMIEKLRKIREAQESQEAQESAAFHGAMIAAAAVNGAPLPPDAMSD